MKKLFITALSFLIVAFAVKAQEIPDRKRDGHGRHDRQGRMHHRQGGKVLQQLNLTDVQKQQLKDQRESFQKQMQDLKKNENITVKEWKARMENLRKEQKTKMESILTADQKSKLENMKKEKIAMQQVDAKARMEKMKIHLGLTNEQVAKMEKNRKEVAEKMKSLRENQSLSAEKKREEMRELMKKQKENMKSILTEEQIKKWQESRPGPGKPGKYKGQKGPKPAEKQAI